MKNTLFLWSVILSLLTSGTAVAQDYSEAFRNQFHFSPASSWMNDPNGLVFYGGEFHLFYQNNPKNNNLGPMHWGHAVSKDLIRWQHLPVALAPDTLGRIFSGSAVVDSQNTSGLFPDKSGGLVAIYTSALNRQQQSIAYSTDKGRTWTKYSGNPVIANKSAKSGLPGDFRDPNVKWNDLAGKWVMVLAVKDHMEIWTSLNLINWTKDSDFGADLGTHGGVWECPDLMSFPDNKGGLKWAMLVSINPGGPNGGSATQYFIGDLKLKDGKLSFITDQKTVKWLDGGSDNYAGITWNNLGDKRFYIAWMSNWDYAKNTPTAPWRGSMTMVRELNLEKEGSEYILTSRPHENYKTLLGPVVVKETNFEGVKTFKPGKELSTSQVNISFKKTNAEAFGVELVTGGGKTLRIGYNQKEGFLFVDRSNLGNESIGGGFSAIHKMGVFQNLDTLDLEFYIDKASVEVFFNQGKYAMTEAVFPAQPIEEIKFFSTSGTAVSLKSLVVTKMESIWK